MAENSRFAEDDIIRLSEEYSTPYNAIIRAHIVMGVSRYFIERWVPLLGTAPATLVNTLRQLNYHTPQEAVTISGNRLAKEACMSRRHLYTCLEAPGLEAFIRVVSGKRTRSETGKVIQEANQYHIRMDDPLNPADAEYLMLQLQQKGDNPIAAVQALLTQSPRDCWAPNPKEPSVYFQHSGPITAKTVLEQAYPNWKASNEDRAIQFAQAADTLHQHVTLVRDDGKTSKVIVPQYFRTRWWSHLGHDLAWSYLWFRGTVYDNPEAGVTRNTCWIGSLDTILTIINRPREWWRRNVEQKRNRAGGWSTADFFEQLATQKGYNPDHPQQVARHFLVRSEIPVAPSDRNRYSHLLIEWPEIISFNTSSSQAETEPDDLGVQHIQTHRYPGGPAHSNTPVPKGSNTFKHTEIMTLCHKQTHRSATYVHRESESLFKALPNASPLTSSKHIANEHIELEQTAAAENQNSESNVQLPQLLRKAWHDTPSIALYQIADIKIWLQQAWSRPINPHTPAWKLATTNQVPPRDVVALMLAVGADRTIHHPPRYISWLLQRWQTQPELEPVADWPRWQALAELPIGQWKTHGKREWMTLTTSENRALPFGLETILFDLELDEQTSSGASDISTHQGAGIIFTRPDQVEVPIVQSGLDNPVRDGTLTINDVWRAALSQLSVKLQRSIYVNWIEGSQAVAYEDGILTVRARHFMAREQLTRRFNPIIEQTLSNLAKTPIKIRYIL